MIIQWIRFGDNVTSLFFLHLNLANPSRLTLRFIYIGQTTAVTLVKNLGDVPMKRERKSLRLPLLSTYCTLPGKMGWRQWEPAMSLAMQTLLGHLSAQWLGCHEQRIWCPLGRMLMVSTGSPLQPHLSGDQPVLAHYAVILAISHKVMFCGQRLCAPSHWPLSSPNTSQHLLRTQCAT